MKIFFPMPDRENELICIETDHVEYLQWEITSEILHIHTKERSIDGRLTETWNYKITDFPAARWFHFTKNVLGNLIG